jgi:uncharacterized membrane protein
MAGLHPNRLQASDFNGISRAKLAGLVFVFLWFLLGGIAHFMATDIEMRIVPPYIKWPHAAVLITGAFALMGAAGLLWRRTRRTAAYGLFMLTILVTPANIYMLQKSELFAVPLWMLIARLPLQLALLVLIIWSSSTPSLPASARSEG